MTINIKTARTDNFGAVRLVEAVRFIVVHYTGNLGDTAKNNAEYFARERVRASAHYFVDEEDVWQSVPDARTAWHVGASKYYHPGCRNANSIGVEICMQDKQGLLRQASIDHAAALVRELMHRYSIPIERVVRHYDVTHKLCPAPMVSDPALWEAFRAKLTEGVETEGVENEMKYYETINEIPAGELRDTVQLLIDREAIAGNGSGLHLSEDMVRMMVYNRRMGLYQ